MDGRPGAVNEWADAGDDGPDAADRLRTLANVVERGVYQVDDDGRFVAVDDDAVAITGYDRGELVGRPAADVLADGEYDHVEREIDRRLRGEGATAGPLECTVRTASDDAVVCELRFDLLLDDDGFHGVVGTIRSLEGRDGVAEQLHDQQRRLERERDLNEQLLDASPVGIVVVDADGQVERINERGRSLLDVEDVDEFDLSQRPTYDETGDPVPVDEHPFAEALATGEPVYDRLLQVELPDGERRWLSVNATPVVDDDGEVARVVTTGEDVTEIKQRAEDLARRRDELVAELDDVYGRITDGFMALNDDWEFTHLNERAEELIGVPGEGLRGEEIWEVHPDIVGTTFEEKYREAMASQEPVTFEAYDEPFGSWFEEHVYPSETGISVYFRDVTERKRMEAELERREQRLSRLIESVPGMVYRCENERGWPMEFVSDACREVTGYDAEALEAGDLSYGDDVVHEADRDYLWNEIQKFVSNDQPFNVEYRIVTADGEVRWVRDSGRRVFNDDGELIALEGIIEDITARKRRENDLELFRNLLDHSTDSVFVVDPDTGEILDVNDTACRERGYDRDELLDMSVMDLETKIPSQAAWEQFADDLRERGSRTFDGVHRCADGSTFPVDINTAYIELDEDYVLSVVRDATEQRAFERMLRALHESSQELHASESRERVGEVMVETVTDVLELPCVGVYRYDEQDGALVPDACTVDDEFPGQEFPRLSADGDSNVAAVFDEGDPHHFHAETEPDRVAVNTSEATMRSATYVPVKDHGVVVAGACDADRIDERHRQLLRILATTAGTAYDRVEREEFLRDKKERLEAATDAGAVGTFEWDISTDEMYTGPAFARLFDVDPEEASKGVTLDRFVDAIHPDDRDRVQRQIRETVEDGGEFESEYRVRNAAGDVRWVVARGHVECDGDGQPRSFPGAVTDITERKRAEMALSRHRDQLQSLFEILPVGVVVANEGGELVKANDAAREIWGGNVFDADSVDEYDKYEGVWADTGEPVAPEEWTMSRVLDGEQVVDPDVVEIEAADGERRVISLRGQPIRDGDGDVVRGVVTQTDITERREYRRKLEESEQRYRTLAENFPNGAVGVYDDDLRYTLTAGSKLGDALPPADEIEGSRMPDVFPGETVADLEPIFRAAVEDGETGSTMTEFGGSYWRVWASPLRDASGDIYAGLSFAQDVTEQIEREERLEELVGKLEESNERLEQFAHATSHDLQEPLRMVSSYLQLIERRYGDDLDEEATEFLEFAVDGADRMSDMIDGLLQYSRVETRGDPLSPVDLDEVVADVLEDLQFRVDETDADLSIDALPTVQGDASQLRQVFQNLLSNALKYHGEEPPTVRVAAERHGDEYTVTVADEGIGIDPDHADRVFEVFQRLHTHDQHAGTGIGLALCQRIVERHDGDIWVESEPGEGSTFAFTLRAADADE